MSDGGWKITEVWSDRQQKPIWFLKRQESAQRLFCDTAELQALGELIRTSLGGREIEQQGTEASA